MRDAIVLSGWTWEARNVPERLAIALNHLGSRILYCENPFSVLRGLPSPAREVQKNIFALQLSFLGHRLNLDPTLFWMQRKLLALQIIKNTERLGLKDPLLVYPHGLHCLGIAREFKMRNFSLIHVCMDYHLEEQLEHVRLSDLTLAIPDAAYDELRIEFGDKIRRLPQLADTLNPVPEPAEKDFEPSELSAIPHPRLLYAGNVLARVNMDLLRKLLSAHPEWHFISFGMERTVSLPNAHLLSWRSPEELNRILDHSDVGFLPYDCEDLKNLHCVPLKLFDYFARGMPVIGTPIVYLQRYQDLVYTGGTPEELAAAVSRALQERSDSPLKQARMKVAADHSIANVAALLASLLEEKPSGRM